MVLAVLNLALRAVPDCTLSEVPGELHIDVGVHPRLGQFQLLLKELLVIFDAAMYIAGTASPQLIPSAGHR